MVSRFPTGEIVGFRDAYGDLIPPTVWCSPCPVLRGGAAVTSLPYSATNSSDVELSGHFRTACRYFRHTYRTPRQDCIQCLLDIVHSCGGSLSGGEPAPIDHHTFPIQNPDRRRHLHFHA